ncbi:MAG: amidase [Halioglobus sp.]
MDIRYRSAFALAKDIKAQTLSSLAVLEYFLSRVEQFNPTLNAVVAMDVENARARATAADNAAANGEDWGPLHGVPVTIKDALCTAGLVTVGGIPECKDHIPEGNATAVQHYLDAGAIVFGKTNVPFMSSDLQSYNDIYGTTNNPWNTDRTCGGSSGGAAAAVAAGLTPLEIGSDIGGSIRTPSHFNGVFGHKSSFGIVSQQGHLPPGESTLSEGDLSVIGPIGTCVDDLEQALEILCGDSGSLSPGWKLALPEASFDDIASLRVAVWADDSFCPVDADIARSITEAGESLQRAGAHVDFSARPDFDPDANHHNYTLLLMAAMGAGMPQAVFDAASQASAAADPSDVSDATLSLQGIAMSHRDWLKQNERRLQTQAAWEQFFQDFDVVLCPSAFVPAFPHDHTPDMQARQLTVNGETRRYTDLLRWSGLTLNTYLPATAVPVGATADGMPVGAQVVSRYMGDRTTLAVARLLEQHHRSFKAPDGY